MYAIEDLRINEPDPDAEPGTQSAKKTICVTLRCDGYESGLINKSYGDTLAPSGRSEVGSNYIYLTIPFSDDPRTVAARIKAKIAEMKVDHQAETVLLGRVRELGASALNA
jgi:hypothetical protein